MRRIGIIGAGPAGLMAAISAAEAGAGVAVFERNAEPGRKLLTTGGGHCNVSSTIPLPNWPERFGKHGRFIGPAMAGFDHPRLRDFFKRIGQPLEVVDRQFYYPVSRSAAAVRNALTDEARRLGVSVRTVTRISGIHGEGAGFRLEAEDAATRTVDAVIFATGGRSVPATGSDGSGYRLAEQCGHSVTPQVAGLVGLVASNLSPHLAGLVLPDASVRFQRKGKPAECGGNQLLLTHDGLSGPAVLDLSASVAEALATQKTVQLTVAWQAGMDVGAWLSVMEGWQRQEGGRPVATLLRKYLPARLAAWLCEQARCGSATPASMYAAARDDLCRQLGAYPVTVTATQGWNKAMVTRGGVALKQINPATMGSRIVKGLYFAGEVMDIDGPCGGFNIHWALASGYLAGIHAARPLTPLP